MHDTLDTQIVEAHRKPEQSPFGRESALKLRSRNYFVGMKHLSGRIAPAFMNLTRSQEYGRQNLDED